MAARKLAEIKQRAVHVTNENIRFGLWTGTTCTLSEAQA